MVRPGPTDTRVCGWVRGPGRSRRTLLAVACAIASVWAGWGAPPALAQTVPTGDVTAPAVDVVELTAEQIRLDYARGAYTAVELTRAFLDRIARYEDRYNAFVSMNPDALRIAAELDREYRTSGPRGPLHGVPVVIKDNMDYEGLVTTAGYWGFSSETGGIDLVPGDDAAVVERLEDAGAIVLGKTNMPDFAGHGTRTESSVAGVTLNPYAVDRVPGGSSGGTATAVNASFAVLGLGTETGGSIQNPAAAQALVGVKPTFGLVPLEGVYPIDATYRDVVGPLAKTVTDAAVALDAIAGPSEEDLATFAAVGHLPEDGFVAALDSTALRGKRFGLVGPGWRDRFLPLDPETETHYRAAIEVLRAQGAEVVEDPFEGSGFKELYGEQPRVPSQAPHDRLVYFRGLGPDAAFHSPEEWEELTGRRFRSDRDEEPEDEADDEEEAEEDRSAGDPDVAERDSAAAGERGRPGRRPRAPARPSATEEGDAFQAWRMEIRAVFRRVLEEHDLDGLFFPQAGAPIRPLVEDPERPDYAPNNHAELPSNIVNELGVPVVTVPHGYYDDGTPFVLAFIGDLWTDADLLAWAYDMERAYDGRRPPELEAGSPGR